MAKRVFLVLVLATASLASGGARGADFYSVDVATDNLVQVSSDTGAVTPLGFLGLDVVDVDLACSGGYLYALAARAGFPVTLVKIDLDTFQVLSSVTVTLSGQPISYAEGLAFLDGRLLIGYFAGDWGYSNAIGELAESGEVTLLLDYRSFDALADFDALTALPNGHLLSADLFPPGYEYYRFVELGLPPDASYTVRGTQHNDNDPNDLEMLLHGDLWGVDRDMHCLLRLEQDGSILETRPYDPSFGLSGLVDQGCGGLPTPTTTTTWGQIKSMYR